MNKQKNYRLPDETQTQIDLIAAGNKSTKTAVVVEAIDKMYNAPSCHCEGRAILGWHAGSWVYCVCKLGISAAMEELSDKLNILADDLRTMPQHECNAASRARKEFLFEQYKAEYDSLERELAKLNEDALQ